MKKVMLFAAALFMSVFGFAQNVGIGTNTPAAKLDVKTSVSPYVAQFNGASPMYMGIYENDIYRGYWGSYSGNAEDVDFGTGSGTTGKLHLTIQAVPKLSINNLGNVGIGTTSPNYKLHVTGGDIFLQSSSGYFKIGYDGADQWRYATTGGGTDLLMQNSTDGTTFTSRHYFSQNGRVGLGTGSTAPGAQLEVSTAASEVIRMKGAHPYMAFYDNTDGYQGYLWYSGGDIALGSSTTGLRFVGGGIVGMRINTDGRVVIGTSLNPAAGYKLSIDGKAICEELKVQLSGSWPDYVFEKKYALKSLPDLEQYISEHKHLPGIPSAESIEKDGILVGDMQTRMMEKIEELTLYIIELDKKNDKLSTELELLKKALKN